MLVLVALAALAVTAYVASTASADRLCEEKIDDTAACPLGKQVIKGSKIVGLDPDATFLDDTGKTILLCASEILAEVTNPGGAGTPVLGSVTKLLFTNCKTICPSAHANNLPYHFETKASSLHALLSRVGGMSITIQDCPFGAKCTYSVTTQPRLLKVGNLDDTWIDDKTPLTLTNPGLCSFFASSAFWDLNYLFTLEPKDGEHVIPIYLTSAG